MSSSVPNNIIRPFRIIESQLNRVKELIDEELNASPDASEINQLTRSMHCRDGKMVRPGLVLLSGGCCNKITDKHIMVAAIIEMIHNATLLHDDVIDEGQKRRGQPTVNSLWGNEAAVLLGDFVLSRVFKMCTSLGPNVSKVIASATVRVCEGELRQVCQKDNWLLNESEYIDVITEKSAILFSSACSLGAILSRASKPQKESLAEFGLNAGIAFQITDDLLDIVGDERKTGKTSGRDVKKHKLTLATIHLLDTVDEDTRETVLNKYLKRKDAQYDKKTLVEMLERHGSLEYAYNQVHEFVARAIKALNWMKKGDTKDALIETAEFIANRTN